jgi:DNA invertase Pin-like site-specific DNA recombinase
MRKIDPNKKLVPEFNPNQPQLPIDKPIIQYIRQSTLGQVKHNLQSQIQQDEMLERRLLAYGWTHDLIIKIALDQGKSGQKLRFERKGLDQLYKMLETGEAAAIACFDASRLWRDQTHVWYNDFIQILKKRNIPVVMWSHAYWCSRPADEEGLRAEFAQAAHELKRIYKMNEARFQAVENGLSYGGGAVPLGYIIREEPGRKFFVPYEPHAEKIRYLFRRFRELGGNLARLGRELVATGFCFSVFDDAALHAQKIRLYDETHNAYVIKTRTGLTGMLTNPVYLGWYVYGDVVVSKTAHEAIVPYDDFLYAYNRLSPYTLDGEENTSRPTRNRTFQTTPALLEGILTGNGYKTHIMGRLYRAMKRDDHLDRDNHTEINVPVKLVDDAFAKGFVKLLVAIKQAAKKAEEPTAMDALAATIDQLSKEKAAEIGTIDEALANVEQGIKEWELQKKVAMKQLYEPGVEEAISQLKTLHATKDMLREKAKAVHNQQNELARTHSLIEEATTQWDKMLFERKQLLVSLIVKSADMTMVTPHILKMVVDLKAPVEGRLVGYIHRKQGVRTAWTDAEKNMLRKLYASASRLEILQALPNRNWVALVHQAEELGIKRPRMDAQHIPDDLSWADMQLIETMLFRGEHTHQYMAAANGALKAVSVCTIYWRMWITTWITTKCETA